MKTPIRESTNEEVFYAVSEQSMDCFDKSARQMRDAPQLRVCISAKAMRCIRDYCEKRMGMVSIPREDRPPEFRGAILDIVPGEDLFFHTRCTNLPE